jgi:hypothetical protein
MIDIRQEWKATHSITPIRWLGKIIHVPSFTTYPPTLNIHSYSAVSPLLLVSKRLSDVETQAICIEVHLILALLQDLGDALCVLKLPQVDIRPRLLNGVTNQLGGTCLTLSADYGGLLLLAGLVDDESGALGFLLGDLLGFDCGGEFGGECEVL